jgi:excisionase family DNA binding protein
MKLLTVKDLSELLSVKQSTLYSWAAKGLIPSLKLNCLLRFDIAEITDWLEKLGQDTSGHEKIAKKPSTITASYDIKHVIRKIIDESKNVKV